MGNQREYRRRHRSSHPTQTQHPPQGKRMSRRRRQRKGRRRRALLAVVLLLLLLATVYAVAKLWVAVSRWEKKAEQSDFSASAAEEPEQDEIINVAIFGTDEDGFRADVNMVASFHTATGELHFISVPRDSKVTMQGIQVINAVCDLPVLRPLAGMDKAEIIERAEKIGTFEISIRPYEDCCTVFVAKHPVTKPRLHYIEKAEHKLTELDRLLAEAVANAEVIDL